MAQAQKIVESIDVSDDKGRAEKEIVETMAKLAESKVEFFKLQIEQSLRTAGNQDNLTIPVESIIEFTSEIRALSENSLKDIPNVVNESLKGFVTGAADSIISGVTNLIAKGLSVFLGEASASTGELHRYYVVTEGLAIVRIDMKAWYLNVESAGLRTKMQKVTAFVACKSAVNLEAVKFNTFLNVYQKQLSEGKLTHDQILQAIKEAKEIFELYRASQRPAQDRILKSALNNLQPKL